MSMILSDADFDAVGDAMARNDPMSAHVVSLMGEPAEWKVGCPWALATAVLVNKETSSTWPIPVCAVVSPCGDCGRVRQEGPNGTRMRAHGWDHALINGRGLLLETMQCGLTLDGEQARAEGGWMYELRAAHGAGVYSVIPGVSASGGLVGLNPEQLLELAE